MGCSLRFPFEGAISGADISLLRIWTLAVWLELQEKMTGIEILQPEALSPACACYSRGICVVWPSPGPSLAPVWPQGPGRDTGHSTVREVPAEVCAFEVGRRQLPGAPGFVCLGLLLRSSLTSGTWTWNKDFHVLILGRQ